MMHAENSQQLVAHNVRSFPEVLALKWVSINYIQILNK
jgi:hypothetical protein